MILDQIFSDVFKHPQVILPPLLARPHSDPLPRRTQHLPQAKLGRGRTLGGALRPLLLGGGGGEAVQGEDRQDVRTGTLFNTGVTSRQ